MKITATIITLDEERNIARAIESLRCCDEILILDSGSTDRTVELAANLGARVIEAGWRGYAGQKNWAAEQATHDWILSLDADEALSEALEAEIWNLKKSGPRFDAYTMPRLARYLGRWIYHSGWYPDRKIRLYDRRKAKWVGEFVHESVRSQGRVGNLESNILHFTCDSLSEHLKTLDRYTTLAAQELAASKVTGADVEPDLRPALEFRQGLHHSARLPGRVGRADHLLHGRVLYVSEILQSEKHELMRILHLDAGREMRGGQWQVLRLIEGLAAAGVESTLLAREGAPLYTAARKQGWRVEPLGITRAMGCLRGHHLIHAHDARSHSLGAFLRGRPLVVSRRVSFPVGSRWKYGRARRYLAVSEFVKKVLMQGGVPEEKISVVYDGVPVLEVSHGKQVLGLEKGLADCWRAWD